MAIWIPGPARYSWPARPRRKPEPDPAATQVVITKVTKVRQTRRTKKTAD